MLKKIKINRNYVIGICAILVFIASFLFAAGVQALDIGLGYGDNIGLGNRNPIEITLGIIQLALGLLGLIVVILILYAGFIWMTAGGNEAKIEQAKKIIRNAVIGLVIILASWGIVRYVLYRISDLTGGQLNQGSGPYTEMPRNVRALGDGIIENVYPEPGQRDVPMNTIIVVTFREKIDPGTICETTAGGFCAPGSDVKTENIRIFKNENSADCMAAPPCVFAADATVTSNDNLTFIFAPKERLGSLSQNNMQYSAYLTRAIKKENGQDAFRSLENGFVWSFAVTNRMDIEPPQVLQYGVFPFPDNERDLVGVVTDAVQAVGSIEVKSQPKVYESARLINTQTVAGPDVNTEINVHCKETGVLQVVMLADKITAKLTREADGVALGSTRADGNSIFFPGYFKLTLANAGDAFDAGNTWRVQVAAEIPADTLTIDTITYNFAGATGINEIRSEANLALTATHIKEEINGEDGINSPNPKVTAAISGSAVSLKAKTAGALGNNIALTDNTDALDLVPMHGGKDRVLTTTVKGGSADKPRNSVIQVNFNEAINPLTLSGSSQEVAEYIRVVNADGGLPNSAACAESKDCLSYKCEANTCVGDYLPGKFMVSNSYKTVEFISDNECGINACGEKIYCLPENSRLRAELDAAELADCGGDNCNSRSPFNICGSGICSDAAGNLYPLSKIPMNGIVDMALNSLDGNRSGYADGPTSQSGQPAFNENAPVAVNGDDFIWSFFINNIIDISPPIVESISQYSGVDETEILPGQNGILADNAVQIYFSKLMMSSSLKSGELVFEDPFSGETMTHRLVNLWAHNDNFAVGYWVTKVNFDISKPPDNYPEKTKAYLNHTKFGFNASYRQQLGSGIKDIYQNCYNPSSRSGAGTCFGTPSCCDGAAVPDTTCP